MAERVKITPKEFIKFAKEDIAMNCDRGLVNSSGNLKRAMHCQIDDILNHFDLLNSSKIKKSSFPVKFDLINRLGFIPPDSFKVLNNSRNLLEHDYTLPNKKETLLGIDLVDLYIEKTNNIISKTIKYSDKWKSKLSEVSKKEITKITEESKKMEFKKKNKIIKKDTTKSKVQMKKNDFAGDCNLKKYPSIFFTNGCFNGLLVIGDEAPPMHIVAIADIAMSLQYNSPEFDSPSTVKTKKIKEIEVGSTLLSSEVKKLDKNIISIGNPDINSVTADIMGVERNKKLKFDKNTSMIKAYKLGKDKIAIVIIGYDDKSIRKASSVLANYKNYNFNSDEITVLDA